MTPTLQSRLSKLCHTLLYTGAMLAGMAGHGWAMLAVFVLVFGLWMLQQSPEARLPGSFDAGLAARVGVALVAETALVLFCFALGRGLGGVTGLGAQIPLAAPISLSFAAVPLARALRVPAPTPKFETEADGAGDRDEPASETL